MSNAYVYARTDGLSNPEVEPITHTAVFDDATSTCMPRERGNPGAFTAEQNTALRRALLEWWERPENKHLSQGEVGVEIGIGQQTVSAFKNGRVGASYYTGTKIAHLAGFDGVDDFFRDRGVAVPGRISRFDDPFPRRQIAATNLMQQKRIAPETYEFIKSDPEHNTYAQSVKDSVYWAAVLETADKMLARTKHEDPEAQAAQEAIQKAQARRARAARRAEKEPAKDPPKPRESSPASVRKRHAG